MIKNILFDLGGVFIELTRDEAVRRFLNLGVHDADTLLDPYKQEGIFLGLESGKYTKAEFRDIINKEYNLEVTEEQIGHALAGFVIHVQQYKFNFIKEQLPKNLRLLLVSNTNAYIFEHFRDGRLMPNGASINDYFEKLYTSYEVGFCKPHPEIMEHIIKDAGIRPEETLFIDDGPANTEVGRELGFVCYCPDNGEDWTSLLTKMLGSR